MYMSATSADGSGGEAISGGERKGSSEPAAARRGSVTPAKCGNSSDSCGQATGTSPSVLMSALSGPSNKVQTAGSAWSHQEGGNIATPRQIDMSMSDGGLEAYVQPPAPSYPPPPHLLRSPVGAITTPTTMPTGAPSPAAAPRGAAPAIAADAPLAPFPFFASSLNSSDSCDPPSIASTVRARPTLEPLPGRRPSQQPIVRGTQMTPGAAGALTPPPSPPDDASDQFRTSCTPSPTNSNLSSKSPDRSHSASPTTLGPGLAGIREELDAAPPPAPPPAAESAEPEANSELAESQKLSKAEKKLLSKTSKSFALPVRSEGARAEGIHAEHALHMQPCTSA